MQRKLYWISINSGQVGRITYVNNLGEQESDVELKVFLSI